LSGKHRREEVKTDIIPFIFIAEVVWMFISCFLDDTVWEPPTVPNRVLLHINQQTILTPEEIANPTYIYTA
jgi:hypothetical protein